MQDHFIYLNLKRFPMKNIWFGQILSTNFFLSKIQELTPKKIYLWGNLHSYKSYCSMLLLLLFLFQIGISPLRYL